MLKHVLTTQEISANREEIISLLRSTKREGVEKLISCLNDYGFFKEQPRSKHHCWVGGLAQHSLETFKKADASHHNLDRNSLIIACLLHDLCKLHRMLDSYPEIRQRYPHGHGSRSRALVEKTGLKLMGDEGKAIECHMHRDKNSQHSLQAVVHIADTKDASTSDDFEEMREQSRSPLNT